MSVFVDDTLTPRNGATFAVVSGPVTISAYTAGTQPAPTAFAAGTVVMRSDLGYQLQYTDGTSWKSVVGGQAANGVYASNAYGTFQTGNVVSDASTYMQLAQFTPTESGAAAWYDTIASFSNPGGTGALYKDTVRRWGWNAAGGGGRVDGTKPAFADELESYYKPYLAYPAQFERHVAFYGLNGATYRPISILASWDPTNPSLLVMIQGNYRTPTETYFGGGVSITANNGSGPSVGVSGDARVTSGNGTYQLIVSDPQAVLWNTLTNTRLAIAGTQIYVGASGGISLDTDTITLGGPSSRVAKLYAKQIDSGNGTLAISWNNGPEVAHFDQFGLSVTGNTGQPNGGAGITFNAGSNLAVGAASTGVLRFNELTNKIQSSLNGAAYADLGTVTSVAAGAGLSGGTITTTGTISMPNTGPGAATYGGGTAYVNSVTLDAQGRVTAVATGTPAGGGSVNGLLAAYQGASAASQNIVLLTTALGPIGVKDNATPLGASLFYVGDSSTNKWLDVESNGQISLGSTGNTTDRHVIIKHAAAPRTTYAAYSGQFTPALIVQGVTALGTAGSASDHLVFLSPQDDAHEARFYSTKAIDFKIGNSSVYPSADGSGAGRYAMSLTAGGDIVVQMGLLMGGQQTAVANNSTGLSGVNNVSQLPPGLLIWDRSFGTFAAPAFDTGGGATTGRANNYRIIMYPNQGTATVDWAYGVHNNGLWESVDSISSTRWFAWYGGTTEMMRLVGNTTGGTGAQLLVKQQSIANNTTMGLQLVNSTAATSGAATQQWSPGLQWTGQQWNSTASVAVDWMAQHRPVSGQTTAGDLVFFNRYNAGAWSEGASFRLNGGRTLLYGPGSIYLGLGTVDSIWSVGGGYAAYNYNVSATWEFAANSVNVFRISSTAAFPTTDNAFTNGASGQRWKQNWAYQYCGVRQSITNSGAITVDPTAGQTIVLTASGNITGITLSAGQADQTIKLILIQNAAGTATWPSTMTNATFAGGSFTKSTGANAVDGYLMVYDDANSKWHELSRSLNQS